MRRCHSLDLCLSQGCHVTVWIWAAFLFSLFFLGGGGLWGPNLAVFRDYPQLCLGMGPGGAQETMCCLQHAKHALQPHLNSATPWATFSKRPVLFDFNSFQLSFSFMSGKSTSCRLPGGDRLHPAHQGIFLTPRACWAFFVGLWADGLSRKRIGDILGTTSSERPGSVMGFLHFFSSCVGESEVWHPNFIFRTHVGQFAHVKYLSTGYGEGIILHLLLVTPKGSFSFSQFLKELWGSSLFAVALSWTFSVIYTPLDTMCNILGWYLYSLLSNKCRWQAGCFYCLPPLRTNLLWGGIWGTWPCCLCFSETSILYPQLRIFCAGVIFSPSLPLRSISVAAQ